MILWLGKTLCFNKTNRCLSRIQLVTKLAKYSVDRISTWVCLKFMVHAHTMHCYRYYMLTFSMRINIFICTHATWETNSISPVNNYENCFTYYVDEENQNIVDTLRNAAAFIALHFNICKQKVITIPDNRSENFVSNFIRILWTVIMVHCFLTLFPEKKGQRGISIYSYR